MAKVWTEEKRNLIISLLKRGLENGEIANVISDVYKTKVTPKQIEKVIYNYGLSKNRKPKKVKAINIMDNLDSLDEDQLKEFKEKITTNWNVSQKRAGKLDKKPFKTWIALYDQHVPLQNDVALKSIFYLMEDIKFDGVVLGGDFMDMGPISHWSKNKKKTLERKRMIEDYMVGNSILDEIDKRLPNGAEKHYLWGNHEAWYHQLIEEYPMLDGYFHPNIELKMDERGYKTYEYNETMKIGRLTLTHGTYAGMNPVTKHVMKNMTNMMFGHVHSPEFKCFSSDVKEIALVGYSVGCLCNKNPDFMKNRPNNWGHGFAVIYEYDNGFFDVDLKRIVKGKFVFNNKLYDGNK